MNINKLPVWVCVVLVVVAFVGTWILLGVQFGHMTIRLG